jgi:hypothetical protein
MMNFMPMGPLFAGSRLTSTSDPGVRTPAVSDVRDGGSVGVRGGVATSGAVASPASGAGALNSASAAAGGASCGAATRVAAP